VPARAAVLLALLTLASVGVPALAVDPADWRFGPDTPQPITLPPAVVQAPEFGQLEYDGPPYRGLRADLNGDGVPEYIVRSAPSLCGNGGCVYALFDGASLRPLGLVFGGAMVVRAAPAGGFAVIHALSHLSAEAASYTTFAYDGRRYARGTSVELRGPALERLVQEIRRVPAQ
jgi:hypothetical protein